MDFVDIVTWKFLFERKEVTINRKTASEWDRIATDNPDVVVLFCTGLRDPIKPAKHEKVCRSWTPIPEGLCYLTACVHCIKWLSEACKGILTRPKLTNRLYWHRPRGGSLFEDCTCGKTPCCHRLQELAEKKANAPGPLQPHGAVIFGKKSRHWWLSYENS